ncbi:MAG: DUF262 domain-containing protein, partial [Alphaproteobacteria bacterium]
MSFNPKPDYRTFPSDILIKDFFEYKEMYIIRPPYQRKAVWNAEKKQALMESLFRGYYVPKLVVREVRLSESQTVKEIIDGQQRIKAVQDFFDNNYKLPKSLDQLGGEQLGGCYYKDLKAEVRQFVDRHLKYQADIITAIDDPHNVDHQKIATEIFWRLQQGEPLNYMEVAHAQLSSVTRNFIVKYSDDQTFNYEDYKPVENNPDKLPFFSLMDVDNKRMKHLQLMARFVMIELNDGYTDIGDKKIVGFIDSYRKD